MLIYSNEDVIKQDIEQICQYYDFNQKSILLNDRTDIL